MKDNYTQIPNELLEEMASSKSFSEKARVFSVILRKTYGWHKEKDWIALSQFEAMTGMKIPNVSRALRKLIKEEIIIKMDNKNYQIGYKLLSKQIDTKETVRKENLTKEKYREFKNSFLKDKSIPHVSYEDIKQAENNL